MNSSVRRAKQLWLVRHGATDWSDAGRLTGWTDVPLNEAGKAQATELRAALSGRAFSSVWSSDLTRSRDTARLAGFDARPDQRLREIDFGALEGSTWATLAPAMRDALVAFDGFSAPAGESVCDLWARLTEFIDTLDCGTHLVFTHGGVIRLLLRVQGDHVHVAPGETIVVNYGGELRSEDGSGTR